MPIKQKKFDYALAHLLRDTRPLGQRISAFFSNSDYAGIVCLLGAIGIILTPVGQYYADLTLLIYLLYWRWLAKYDRTLCFKMPAWSPYTDKKERGGKAQGILFMGNSTQYNNEECWFSNNDARTHILYLGTTGAGKTEGLKSIASNALMWGSGFIYVDGKADTDLWSSLSALVRRFGRDDDMLVLNYMTGNSDDPAPSNSLNPFASGSASYLTQLLVSLMPDAGGDNAMWKERAISLLSALMPALTWKRDHQEMPVSINLIRQVMNFPEVIKLSRDTGLPERIREGIKGYLDTLPGYLDDAFDDQGMEKPMSPDQPMVDSNTVKQQHGYLTMQFTRALQSLGNDYGYIFEAKNADIEMLDVVLNRRILVVLIPALEKSPDESANLGKIVAATLKGMMGATLGASVEGSSATVIDNKATRSSTPFITVFDEVGYYTTPGMGVMAAQARSLGFCLVYASQDIAAMEKRVKEEARSITGNCNIKIFGKIEDPMGTVDFFDKTVGQAMVTEVTGWENDDSMTSTYFGGQSAKMEFRGRATFDELKTFKEGDAILVYTMTVNQIKVFYANPGHAQAMRVQRFIGLPRPNDFILKNIKDIALMRDRLSGNWRALKDGPPTPISAEIKALADGTKTHTDPLHAGAQALVSLAALDHDLSQLTQPSKPAPATTLPGADDDEDDFADLMDDDETQDEDDESGTATSSGGASKAPDIDIQQIDKAAFDPQKAVETKVKEGITLMPEGLSEEVRTILKSAADDLAAELFGTPQLINEAAASGDSRTIKPGHTPFKT